MTLGERIKEARKKYGLSQEQLAEKMAVSRSAVAKWEANNGLPDVDNLKALSSVLNISIDYLLNYGKSIDAEEQNVFCSECGKEIVAQEKFCSKCEHLVNVSNSGTPIQNSIGSFALTINRAKQWFAINPAIIAINRTMIFSITLIL